MLYKIGSKLDKSEFKPCNPRGHFLGTILALREYLSGAMQQNKAKKFFREKFEIKSVGDFKKQLLSVISNINTLYEQFSPEDAQKIRALYTPIKIEDVIECVFPADKVNVDLLNYCYENNRKMLQGASEDDSFVDFIDYGLMPQLTSYLDLYCVRDIQASDNNAVVLAGSAHTENIEKILKIIGFTTINASELSKDNFYRLPMKTIRAQLGVSTPSDKAICEWCHSQKQNMNVCAKCKAVSYCSKDCQKADWKAHKKACKELTDGGSSSTKK